MKEHDSWLGKNKQDIYLDNHHTCLGSWSITVAASSACSAVKGIDMSKSGNSVGSMGWVSSKSLANEKAAPGTVRQR